MSGIGEFVRLLGRYQQLDHSEGPVVSEPSPQQVWLLSVWYHVSTLVYSTNHCCLGAGLSPFMQILLQRPLS